MQIAILSIKAEDCYADCRLCLMLGHILALYADCHYAKYHLAENSGALLYRLL
jgi:hypothetical protein